MNEYSIFYNGSTWTCEVENKDGKIVCEAIGNSQVEALQNAIKEEVE